jgi:hypothetical protein
MVASVLQLFDGAALGVLETQFLVGEPPLDTVALGQRPPFRLVEHIDLPHRAQPRIPADDPAMLIGQLDDLPPVGITPEADHAIFCALRDTQPGIVARS